MHLDPALIRRIAVCSYEGEMNAVLHGGDGTLEMTIEDRAAWTRHLATTGPGIEDIDAAPCCPAIPPRATTHARLGFGAGMGLPNMQSNADRIPHRIPNPAGARGCA